MPSVGVLPAIRARRDEKTAPGIYFKLVRLVAGDRSLTSIADIADVVKELCAKYQIPNDPHLLTKAINLVCATRQFESDCRPNRALHRPFRSTRTIRSEHRMPNTPLTSHDNGRTHTGTIKRLIVEKGFGFLADANGTEYFFHRSSCVGSWDSLYNGQEVRFTVEPSQKGPRAASVEPA